jgi:hypothetical protein
MDSLVAEGEKPNYIRECLLKTVWQSKCGCVYCFVVDKTAGETGGADVHGKVWHGCPCTAVMCDNICQVDELMYGNCHITN